MMFLREVLSCRRILGAAVALIAVAFGACSDGNGPTDDGTDVRGLSATIDGVPYRANENQVRVTAGDRGGYEISARPSADRERWLTLVLYQIGDTGVYPLGTINTFSGGRVVVRDSANTKNWETPSNGASGTVHITTLTADRIAGTFTAVATQCPRSSCLFPNAATGTRQIQSGKFDVAINPSAPVDTSRRKFRLVFDGTLNGVKIQPVKVSCVACAQPGSNNPQSLGFHIGTERELISVWILNFTGPGTYQFSENPNRSISVSQIDILTGAEGSVFWASRFGGSTGSITVTKVENGRIALTFVGGLSPSSAAAFPISINATMEFSMSRDFP